MRSRRQVVLALLGAVASVVSPSPSISQLLPLRLVLRRENGLPVVMNLNDCVYGKLYERSSTTASDPGRLICDTLELPYRNEQKEISCIKPGRYSGFVRTDDASGRSLGWRIQLKDTKQLAIQIHPGNTTEDTRGCILVGDAGDKCTLKGGTSKPARDRLKAIYGEGTARPVELTVE